MRQKQNKEAEDRSQSLTKPPNSNKLSNQQIANRILRHRYSNTLCRDHRWNLSNVSNSKNSGISPPSIFHHFKNQTVQVNKWPKQKKFSKEKKQQWLALHQGYLPVIVKDVKQVSDKHVSKRKVLSKQLIYEFSYRVEPSRCLDNNFPIARIHSSMVVLQTDKYGHGKEEIYLIGGIGPEMKHKLHVHRLSKDSLCWESIASDDKDAPLFNISQHSVVQYRRMIYLIGGISIFTSLEDSTGIKRYHVPYIYCFNTLLNRWARINWHANLRGHAACVHGRFLFVDGGIDENNKTNPHIYAMDLEFQNPPISLAEEGVKVAFHKMVSTEQVQTAVKPFLKVQGLFLFGGKHEDSSLNPNLYSCELQSKIEELTRAKKIQWVIQDTTGIRPCPRYGHSMNILNTKSTYFEKKSFITIMGGRDSHETILKDIFLLDLTELSWAKVIFAGQPSSILSNGIADHVSACTENRIYVFGGYNSNYFSITDFWTLSYEKNAINDSHKQVSNRYDGL